MNFEQPGKLGPAEMFRCDQVPFQLDMFCLHSESGQWSCMVLEVVVISHVVLPLQYLGLGFGGAYKSK